MLAAISYQLSAISHQLSAKNWDIEADSWERVVLEAGSLKLGAVSCRRQLSAES
jgi:hypothetical protein